MDAVDTAVRRLGEEFSLKWNERRPGLHWGIGSGWMAWHDADGCMIFDFYGKIDAADRVTLAGWLIMAQDKLGISFALRIGFHETEEDAKRLMYALFVGEEEAG